MKKHRLLFLALLLPMFLVACRPKLDTTNPVVVSAATLNNAEKVVNTTAHGLLAADQVLEGLKTSEPEYYAAAKPALQNLARLNETANQCVVTAVKGGTCNWQQAVVQLAAQAGQVQSLTSFGFKNSSTQQEVQVGFAALVAAIQLAVQFQQAVKGGV